MNCPMSYLSQCYEEDRALLLPANVGGVGFVLDVQAAHFILTWLFIIGGWIYLQASKFLAWNGKPMT